MHKMAHEGDFEHLAASGVHGEFGEMSLIQNFPLELLVFRNYQSAFEP